VEVAREVARRFNRLYGEVFPIPESLIGRVPALVGTDGRAQMSKSLGNAIFLCDSPDTVRAKVMSMFTDPRRVRADVPGEVEGNPFFIYHRAFNRDREEVADLEQRYPQGTVGDVEVKERLALALNAFLDPIRARRQEMAARPGLVAEVLAAGSVRARRLAEETMREVRSAMGLYRLPLSG